MTEDTKLSLLKSDLQMLTNANDDYLKALLKAAMPFILREGIRQEDTDEFDMIHIQYAAYLFRKRSGNDTAMPRFLRLEMNNLLLSQKGREADDI